MCDKSEFEVVQPHAVSYGKPVTEMSLRTNRKQTCTTNAMKQIAQSLDTGKIDQVLQRTGKYYDVSSVLMTLECPEVKFVASWGTVPRYHEKQQAHRARLFRTIERPLPVLIGDVHQETIDECEALDPNFRFYAGFPIRLADEYVGSIVMTSSVPHPRTNLADFNVLEDAAEDLAELLQEQLQRSQIHTYYQRHAQERDLPVEVGF